MPRSPEQIQQEIDAARESLGATLDELAFRTNPQRLSDQAKAKVQEFLASPPGVAIVSVVGLGITFVVTRGIVRRIRHTGPRRETPVTYRWVADPDVVVQRRRVRASRAR
ncbi:MULTISPECIES: DUF3618 domain-containing protein [unclassified Modestobacter]